MLDIWYLGRQLKLVKNSDEELEETKDRWVEKMIIILMKMIITSIKKIIILMKTEDGSDVDHDGDSDNQIQL